MQRPVEGNVREVQYLKEEQKIVAYPDYMVAYLDPYVKRKQAKEVVVEQEGDFIATSHTDKKLEGDVRTAYVDYFLQWSAETNNEVVDGAIYPFADSGKVKDVYLVRWGNGGYRTIICLMKDGSLSALSANELIKDHITVVWDNLTGRDTYVSVEERASEEDDGYGVVGITEDGEEIDLDFSLDF